MFYKLVRSVNINRLVRNCNVLFFYNFTACSILNVSQGMVVIIFLVLVFLRKLSNCLRIMTGLQKGLQADVNLKHH